MTATPQTRPIDVITGEVRIAYPTLFEAKPRARGETDPAKFAFQATILIPATVDLTPYKNALMTAMVAKWGRPIQLDPAKVPLRPCATKAGYERAMPGGRFINLSTKQRPAVVDRNGAPIVDPQRIYGGCFVRAYINAFAWDNPVGGKGLSFGLNGIQFLRDGDRIDGRLDAAEVFGVLPPLEGADLATNSAPVAPNGRVHVSAPAAGRPGTVDVDPFGLGVSPAAPASLDDMFR